jgi:hypothetical protein
MTTHVHSVDEVLDRIAAAIYDSRLGYLAVSGVLTDWRRHRYGSGSAELVAVDSNAIVRLRLHANPHAAAVIDSTFGDADYDPSTPAAATAHGQIVLHRRFGLQLDTATIDLHQQPHRGLAASAMTTLDNHASRWPPHIDTIGLVSPIDGDDARLDVLAVLAPCPLTVIEHRVPVSGSHAVWRISRALDTLAGDQRLDLTVIVRGGGADIDLSVFNHPTVVAAIDRHPRPVITGIGHATNTTRADEAAHTSCITPTDAARLLSEALG